MSPTNTETIIDTPLEEGPREFNLAPGVVERLTHRFYLHFREVRQPLIVAQEWPRRGVLSREIGYFMLRGLELFRRHLRSEGESRARFGAGAYRSLRNSLASNLWLPSNRHVAQVYEWKVSVDEQDLMRLEDSRRAFELAEGHLRRFEASRRVFEFEAVRGYTDARSIVCYVFAVSAEDATERLLLEFADAVRHGKPRPRVYDPKSELVLVSEASRRLARRAYWEVVIAPKGALSTWRDLGFAHDTWLDLADYTWRDEFYEGSSATSRLLAGQQAAAARTLAGKGMEAERPRIEVVAAPQRDTVDGACDDDSPAAESQFEADIRADWDFVMSEIEKATDRGQQLNDAFVEDVARRRLQRAREGYGYPDEAGPTFESSTRIVRDILELHLLAIDPDRAQGPERV